MTWSIVRLLCDGWASCPAVLQTEPRSGDHTVTQRSSPGRDAVLSRTLDRTATIKSHNGPQVHVQRTGRDKSLSFRRSPAYGDSVHACRDLWASAVLLSRPNGVHRTFQYVTLTRLCHGLSRLSLVQSTYISYEFPVARDTVVTSDNRSLWTTVR